MTSGKNWTIVATAGPRDKNKTSQNKENKNRPTDHKNIMTE